VLRRHAQNLRTFLLDATARATHALEPELTRAWLAVEAELTTVCVSCALSEPEHHR
jgi:hypothetical protein